MHDSQALLSYHALLWVLEVGDLTKLLLDAVADGPSCLVIGYVQEGLTVTVAPLLTLFADPIRVACFARVVCICLAGVFSEVQSHAFKRFVAGKFHWPARNHYHTALCQSVGRKRCANVLYDSLLA